MAKQQMMWPAGGSANGGKDFRDLIHNTLALHANWEFVEDLAVAARIHRIWKCKAVGNAAGQDFYVALSGEQNEWQIRAFEGWDAVGKLASRPVVRNQNVAPASDGSYGGGTGYALNDAALFNAQCTEATNSGHATCLVNADRIVVTGKSSGSSSTTTAAFTRYAGLIETLLGGTDDPMPLVLSAVGTGTSTTSASTYGGSSRHPRKPSQGAENWAFSLPYTTSDKYRHGYAPDNPTISAGEMYWNDANPLGRATIVSDGANSVYGGLRGFARDVYASAASVGVSATAYPPTIVIGSEVFRAAAVAGAYYLWVSEAD